MRQTVPRSGTLGLANCNDRAFLSVVGIVEGFGASYWQASVISSFAPHVRSCCTHPTGPPIHGAPIVPT